MGLEPTLPSLVIAERERKPRGKSKTGDKLLKHLCVCGVEEKALEFGKMLLIVIMKHLSMERGEALLERK